jgi:hypothetical protein
VTGWVSGHPQATEITHNEIHILIGAGFLKESGRCNVAMTRAKGVFWVLGGKMDPKWHKDTEPLSYFPRLKKELEGTGKTDHGDTGHVHAFARVDPAQSK